MFMKGLVLIGASKEGFRPNSGYVSDAIDYGPFWVQCERKNTKEENSHDWL